MSETSTEKSSSLLISIQKAKELKEQREQRFLDLAKPKHSKAIWACVEPPMKWGNQETIRPLSNAAKNLKSCSDRVTTLSTPKKDFLDDHPVNRNRPFFVHSTGRSSVIEKVSPVAIKGTASGRVEELSQPKKISASFQSDRDAYVLSCGRVSPITTVAETARKASERERTTALATPKALHKDYQLPRQPIWPVTPAAMKGGGGALSDYIEKLAQHKSRLDGPHRDAEWVVSKQARHGKASNRVQELSQPKKYSDKYQASRGVDWRVSKSALRAYATERLETLAKPIVRDTMDHVQFDPLAFQVKESALRGRVPDRIHELARPIRTT